MTAIGRVKLQFPEGRSQTFPLDEAAITIGSGRDNSVQAPHAGLAKRQLRFFRKGDAAYMNNLDGRQAVSIDGRPAPVDSPQRLASVSHIRAGDLSIVFSAASDESTVAMEAISEATQPMAAAFHAELECAEIKVFPYSIASALVRLENHGRDEGRFSLETAGPAAAWTSPERLAFSVDGNDSLEVLLQIAPPRRSEFAPGDYPMTITIRRLDGEEDVLQLVQIIRLGAFAGLSAALDPPDLRPGSPFQLRLINRGNQDLRLRLGTKTLDRTLSVELAQDELRLGPGEGAAVSGIVEARRRPIFGAPREIALGLLVQARPPHDYIVSLPATVTVQPAIPKRAALALLLGMFVLILALAALLYQPPLPEINAFGASERQVAQGKPVELRWNAAHAERIVIEVDRAPVAELPGEAARFTLDTSAYADPIEIALIALNGDYADIMTLSLDIFQPLIIGRFEANKSMLLRDIPSDLTISWRVENAVALDIALPTGFETLRETGSGESGEIVISGAAVGDLKITLRAEDEIGETTERALSIAVRAPECTPIADTALFAGPDSRFDRASYARRNAPVRATGLSADRDWLQVELANGESGWGARVNFRCHGFDPAQLSQISDLPPPTPTHLSADVDSALLR